MTNVPTKLAKLVFLNAMDNNRITLAVVKLNNTSVSMNFQNAGTVATSPTSPYTIPPNRRGGTRRNGRISKRTYIEKRSTEGKHQEEEPALDKK